MAIAVTGGLAYPLLVYFGMMTIPPAAFLLVGLGLIALRLAASHRVEGRRMWMAALLVAACSLAGLFRLSPTLAVKAYPVAISLAVAAVFGLSLRFPPTVVERFARLAEPDLPAEGIAYTRKVTWVWLGFLLANAAVSTATALWGTLAQWTLWNGLLSYVAMGLLFAAEFLVRRTVRRRRVPS